MWLLLPSFGAEATGLGYLARYVIYLPVLYLLAKSLSGLRWGKGVVALFLYLMVALVFLIVASFYGEWVRASLCASILVVFGVGVYFYLFRSSAGSSLGHALKRAYQKRLSSK